MYIAGSNGRLSSCNKRIISGLVKTEKVEVKTLCLVIHERNAVYPFKFLLTFCLLAFMICCREIVSWEHQEVMPSRSWEYR